MSTRLDFSDLLFSGGSGRSGTTVVGKMIGRHPAVQVAVPLEIKFLTAGNGLLDLAGGRRFHKNGKPILRKDGNLRLFEKSVVNKWWIVESKSQEKTGLHLGIDQELLMQLLDELRENFYEDRVMASRIFFRKYVDSQLAKRDRSRWIDTTPPNLMRSSEIVSLLPGAKFIHMIRDGRDVASSVVKEKWGPSEHFEALEWWRERLMKIISESKKNPEAILHVWLEDLIHFDRDESFNRILSFTNLPEAAPMKRYFDDEMQPKAAHSNRWQSEVGHSERFSNRYIEIYEELVGLGLPKPKMQL
jgi:Sulfotransferase family